MTTVSQHSGTLQGHAVAVPALQRYSAELRLVLLCLRWPLGDHNLQLVWEAAESIADWEHFLRIVRRHRVAGLVAGALQRAGVVLPQSPAADLRRLRAQNARQALLLSVETLRLSRLLQDAGVEVLFLKGAAVAMLAYRDISVRHSKDIDLLVPLSVVDAAMAVLRKGGYQPAFDLDTVPSERRDLWIRYAKSMDWVHSSTGVQLELHWRLTDLSVLGGGTQPQSTQHVSIAAGQELQTLPHSQLLAYLCVHGAAHGWMRLKWLADVYALLPHDDPARVEEAYRDIMRLKAGRAAGQAMLLCHDLFDLPLTSTLLRELESGRTLQLLRRSALRLLGRGGEVEEVDDMRFGTTSVYLARLLLGRGPRALATEFRTWGFRPDELLKTRLPRPLMFLFPLVRIGTWIRDRLQHGGRSPQSR